jgi:hypothetical protein
VSAGALAFAVMVDVPRFTAANVDTVFGGAAHGSGFPVWAAQALAGMGIIVAVAAMWQVFTKVSCIADRFFGRYALLPPPYIGEL